MTEFKQIIGRGTRVREDYGKTFFNILDYTGSATRLFADPDFDGDPIDIIDVDIDGQEETLVTPDTTEPPEPTEPSQPTLPPDSLPGERRKFYFDGGQVQIAAHLVYELDPDGKQLRVVQYTDYTAEKVRSLYVDDVDLRGKWADPQQRKEIIERLAQRGIDFDELVKTAGQPDADPLDLLCHLAFNAPLRTRSERAQRLRTEKKDFFDQFGPDVRQILEELLDKYTQYGTAQFILPDVLELPPINEHGNVMEIAKLFGGPDKLRAVVNELQTLLYVA
jgi:type I restriction enzyme R subunit